MLEAAVLSWAFSTYPLGESDAMACQVPFTGGTGGCQRERNDTEA